MLPDYMFNSFDLLKESIIFSAITTLLAPSSKDISVFTFLLIALIKCFISFLNKSFLFIFIFIFLTNLFSL